MHAQSLSPVQLSATPWIVAHQIPLSMGFFRQGYWNGLPFPPPGDLTNSTSEPTSPMSPVLQVDSLPLIHQGSPQYQYMWVNINVEGFEEVHITIFEWHY